VRAAEDLLTSRVRAALGDAYDATADYRVVRPGMVGLPKYADCKVAGEFTEDTRNETKLVILVRPKPAAPPPSKAVAAAERVRSAIASVRPRK
jgi:hypothetical protein